MAKKSRPDVYTEFKTGDVKEILQQYKQHISLLVAADTFIYFNDLNELFSAIETGLEEGGYTVFTLENVFDDNESRYGTWRFHFVYCALSSMHRSLQILTLFVSQLHSNIDSIKSNQIGDGNFNPLDVWLIVKNTLKQLLSSIH